MTIHRRHRAYPAAVIAAAALALAGCGDSSDDPEGASPPEATATSTETGADDVSPDDSPDQGDSDSDDSDGSDSAEDAENLEDLIAAGHTAADQVDDATVVSLEDENSGDHWEVKLYTSDGTAYELNIASDGSDVIDGPTKDEDEEADLAKHRDRLDALEVDFEQAAHALSDEFPGGRITELGIDTTDGTPVWEADVIDADGTQHEVDLDAGTAEILTDEAD